MNWAQRRQRIIVAILILVTAALVAVVVIAITYKAPSCMDNIKNQGETGVDCGGPCSTLCTADEVAPRVLFVRTVSPAAGRTDVIAYVSNENPNAVAPHATYTLELYDSNNQILAKRQGTVTLPPSATIPLFISNVYDGNGEVTQAFLTFDNVAIKWQRSDSKQVVPIQGNYQWDSNTQNPRVSETLTNPTANTLFNETVVATVFDASDNAIGASQTVIPTFQGQSTAMVVFTWNQPFSTTPVRIEVLPAPLP